MSSEIIDIGLEALNDDELEELADMLEEKIHVHIKESSYWELLRDFNTIVILSQAPDNLLTLTLDFDISGEFSKNEFEKFQKDLNSFAQDTLKEELICRKNSRK
ncbi:MAG: hypothetical protein ACXABK_05695 [Candidatus Heimdallarchaeaceae archaeon]|jgi:hypothetical protein